MKAITLKSVDEHLLELLRRSATSRHRSLNGEILFRLRESLSSDPVPDDEGRLREAAGRQADAWQELGGKWSSDESVEREIAALYAERTPGREQDLLW